MYGTASWHEDVHKVLGYDFRIQIVIYANIQIKNFNRNTWKTKFYMFSLPNNSIVSV